MILREILRVALAAIWSNKIRSLLTMLGIVIGVASVITMVALGEGAQQQVQRQMQQLGTSNLSIYPGQSYRGGRAGEERTDLTTDDAAALAEAKSIVEVVPEQSRSLQIKKNEKNANVAVVGTTPNYFTVQSYEVDFGRVFTEADNGGRKRVAVLGSMVPMMLETAAPALLGTQVWVDGSPFEVIGILKEKGSEGSWRNRDEMVFIPIRTSEFRVFGTDLLNSVTIQAASPGQLTLATIEAEQILRREHGIRPGEENDFRVRNRTEFLNMAEEMSRTFTYLLGGIAAVSLLVGGIGIMNIMLVSVTERTSEIGLRKALGATPGHILQQFLLEAVVLCLLGGFLGIMLGGFGSFAFSHWANWETVVTFGSIVLAVVFSIAVGVLFGILPAKRAASLEPIAALRHE